VKQVTMSQNEGEAASSPLDEILPFEGGGSFPVQYEIDIRETNYYVRYRSSWLTIDRNDIEVFEQCLNPADDTDGEWNNEETTVYLYLISQAIRSGDFETLTLPDKEQAKSHPLYIPGPQPVYVFLNCKEEHEHDLATCPVIYKSPMDLPKAPVEDEVNRTLAQRLAQGLKRLFG